MTVNTPPIHTARVLDQERFRNAAKAAGLQRVAFLAGPYIQIEKAPRKNTKNRASALRYDLFKKLENDGWVVTLGEYQALVSATEVLLGEQNNSALAEINHAKSPDLDAIVMLPSSPGSFLELGAFSNIESICVKMIIIIDSQFEHHVNYLNTGPLKAAKDRGATVFFIDYSKINDCWDAVEKFVNRRARLRAAKDIVAP